MRGQSALLHAAGQVLCKYSIQNGGGAKASIQERVPMRKILNSGSRRVRALTEVLKMQSITMDGFPTGQKKIRVLVK